MPKVAEAVFVSVHLPASATLDSVNGSTKRYEETLGPLVLMKIDNDMTLLKFDALAASPAKTAKVAPQVGGKPDLPSGSVLVTSGQIFIAGQQVLCAATREEVKS